MGERCIRRYIEPDHPEISIGRQCELLSLPRSTYYYREKEENRYNQKIMNLIDEEYTRHPFYGSRLLTAWLNRMGYEVNRKRVRRLMQNMGLQTVYQKPDLSKPAKAHKKYPYLLRGVNIMHPDQVWSSDITYIRMKNGFIYLAAVIDWFSRYVLSFEISNTLDKDFCIRALEKSLKVSKPEIFNTDQGVQFTSDEFTMGLIDNNIAVSMDGRGRALDNIFIERLWRTVKYEEVYIRDYENVTQALKSLNTYFQFYNMERLHQALDYRTPHEVYENKQK
jgi:putative transposase